MCPTRTLAERNSDARSFLIYRDFLRRCNANQRSRFLRFLGKPQNAHYKARRPGGPEGPFYVQPVTDPVEARIYFVQQST